MLRRRHVLAGATVALVSRPAIVRADRQTTLRFIPQIDLAVLDPHATPAYVTRNHGYMVFDTLYGEDGAYRARPQMVEGHTVTADGLDWRLQLRNGLRWHDGEPVLSRDCVASIRRWGLRDPFGAALLAATAELRAVDDRTIQFRLARPFPLLPQALGKSAAFMPAMMPERLAASDMAAPVTEMVGSGPFRFRADEHVPGDRAVYQANRDYLPRNGGDPSGTAGPKRVFFDRVEWITNPDPASAAAALQTGEVDWWDYAAHDLEPVLRANGAVRVSVLDRTGSVAMLRPNWLQPPFDDPAIRRALLPAIDQTRFMQSVTSVQDEYRLPLGVFCPDTPMASDAGLDVFTGPRDWPAVGKALRAAGYSGQPVVLLTPTDYASARGLGAVATEMLQAVGMAVRVEAMDQGTLLQRRLSKAPVDRGGWSLFVTAWSGSDWLNPAGHIALRGTGEAGYPGWSSNPRIEALRDAWFRTGDLAGQAALCRDIQLEALRDPSFYPLGAFLQPTAFRQDLTGVLGGFAKFWNVRRS